MRKRAFSLVELLVVVTIIALLAALLFPAYAQAKRKALFTSATIGLRQIGVATAQYMTDNDNHLPIRNWGYTEYWQYLDDEKKKTQPGPVDDPLAPYGAAGWNPGYQGIKQSDNPMFCPGVNRKYDYRWVFSIREDFAEETAPLEIRRIEPQPTSVLVRCPNLLNKGYSSGDFPSFWTTFSGNPADREGRELLLRGDGSVSNVDTRTERCFVRRPIDGVDYWKEVPAIPGSGSGAEPGQRFSVFVNEAWPPEWTTIDRPANRIKP